MSADRYTADGFLPGYQKYDYEDALLGQLVNVDLDFIDHCVGNQPDQEMESAVNW